MNPHFLRAARTTDAGKVGSILSASIDETEWMCRIHSRAEDIGFAGDLIDRGWVTVVEDACHVTGFVARDEITIQALYVTAGARRQGIGSALLRHAQTQRDTLTLWVFQNNTAAQAFYVAHGFVAVEQTDGSGNDARLPDIRFEWKRESA